MSRQLPSLNALRAFEAAARHRSFTLAAEELCVTQGAISRQIKLLEGYLKVLLFRRLPRALELTPDGAVYLPALRDAFDSIEFATRKILRGNQHSVLTVSVLPTLAMNWIIPSLHEFNEQHPEIEIHMVTSINPADFNTDIDMAIRVGSRHPNASDQQRARIDLVMTQDWSGIEAEVLDLRSLAPLDRDAVLATVAKTSRALLLHEATLTGGIGGELAAIISQDAFEYLDAPVMRVASVDAPVPYAPPLEAAFLPSVDKVVAAAKTLVDY